MDDAPVTRVAPAVPILLDDAPVDNVLILLDSAGRTTVPSSQFFHSVPILLAPVNEENEKDATVNGENEKDATVNEENVEDDSPVVFIVEDNLYEKSF